MTFPASHERTADPAARRGTSDSPPGYFHLVIAQAAGNARGDQGADQAGAVAHPVGEVRDALGVQGAQHPGGLVQLSTGPSGPSSEPRSASRSNSAIAMRRWHLNATHLSTMSRTQTPPSPLTPAVQRRPVAGARRAIPRTIHGARLAIASTARSERRIAVRRPGVGIDASSASADPAGGPWRSTARSCQVPGTPRSSTLPRSSKPVPEPTTRSRTVRETRISPAPAWPKIRAAMCTAMPPDVGVEQFALAGVDASADLRCPVSRRRRARPRRSGWPASGRRTWRGGRRRCSSPPCRRIVA